MTKIFIANLPFHVAAEQVSQLFELFGTVRFARILTEMRSGKSRGFGFLEMGDDDGARRAIATLHDTEIDGRRIAVQIAKKSAEDTLHKRPRKVVYKVQH